MRKSVIYFGFVRILATFACEGTYLVINTPKAILSQMKINEKVIVRSQMGNGLMRQGIGGGERLGTLYIGGGGGSGFMFERKR